MAPLYEAVPPKYYGGTERVVSFLTEALVALGHEVTLFASGDSVTRARLVTDGRHALRLQKPAVVDSLAPHLVQLEQVYRMREQFDVVHFHGGYLHMPAARRLGLCHVTTMHGRLDFPELFDFADEFRDAPLVSISDAQRAPIPQANWVATVAHGLPADGFHFQPDSGDYFAFVGRISPEKRLDRAIEIATRLGIPLRIAAKIDRADESYFEAVIRTLLDHPLVEFLGELGECDKDALLGGARALLFPIDWPEPFGLVMIEAMACGTPVVAFRQGSVPEVIEDGVTGRIVDDVEAAVQAARDIPLLSRARCRQRFEQRFTSERMARDYLEVYRGQMAAGRTA